MQRQNDQKVTSCARAKAQRKLIIIIKKFPPLLKPTFVKLTSKQLLQMSSLNAWGVGSVPQDTTSQMQKYEDLQKMIRSIHFTYAWQLKMTWDVKNWDR